MLQTDAFSNSFTNKPKKSGPVVELWWISLRVGGGDTLQVLAMVAYPPLET